MHWLHLFIAILGETLGTSALAASEGFTRPLPSALAAAGFAVALYFLALSLKAIPIGIAYAIWSGTGIILISLIGLFAFGQRLDPPAILGILLILAGVLVVNLFSKSVVHGPH